MQNDEMVRLILETDQKYCLKLKYNPGKMVSEGKS